MSFCLSLAWLWSPPMWRVSASRGRHLARQSTPERHQKLTATFRLLLISIFSCIFSLYFMSKSVYSGPWHSSEYSKVNKASFVKDVANTTGLKSSFKGPLATCDIYTGTWVSDNTAPVYNSSTCPYAEAGFSCQENGRPDSDYLKWRWQPFGCDIPV